MEKSLKKTDTLNLAARAAFLTLIVFSTTLFAQNTSFTYQGKLADGGNAANGSYDMQFKIYDTGTLLGSLVRDDVQVTGGTFSVMLDYGAGVFYANSARFLEIGVRPGASNGEYTPILPRQELNPVPYSIQSARASKAEDAEKLGGQPPTKFLRNDISQAFTGATLTIEAGSALDVVGALNGNGSNLFNLNASNLSGGTVDDARLSTNIPKLNAYNIFTGGVQFNSPPLGSGEFLTNLTASNLTGTIPDARLSTNVPRLDSGNTFSAVNNNFAGRVSANSLSVGGGLPITKILTGSATLNFGNGRILQEVQNISVIGARVGDAVYLSLPENVLPRQNLPAAPPSPTFPEGLPATTVTQPFVFQAFVSAPDVVSVTYYSIPAPRGFPDHASCLEGADFQNCQPPPGVFRVIVFSFAP